MFKLVLGIGNSRFRNLEIINLEIIKFQSFINISRFQNVRKSRYLKILKSLNILKFQDSQIIFKFLDRNFFSQISKFPTLAFKN
jgi:hypothetical protein